MNPYPQDPPPPAPRPYATARPQARNAEAGNVLFYILIGIVLFAALSFAVANIMNSGAADPQRETRMLAATDVIQYADGLKRAVQAMRIRGVADGKISFESPRLSQNYEHPSTAPQRCLSDDCRVFMPAGGGFTYIKPPLDWLDTNGVGDTVFGHWYFPTGVCVTEVGTGGAGCASDTTDNEELVAILPWVKRDLCIEINDRLSVNNPGGEPPVASADAWPAGNPRFVGTFTEGAAISLGGASAGCLRGAGVPASNSYFYYKVLLAR